MKRIEAGTFKLWRARFDLNRDSTPETVHMYNPGRCRDVADPAHDAEDATQYAWPGVLELVVLDEATGHFNPAYTHYDGVITKEPIFYKGLVYLAHWNDYERKIVLYDTASGTGIGEFAVTNHVCEIRYTKLGEIT